MRVQAGALVVILALGGCSARPSAPTVHEFMSGAVAPQAQVLWDISNRAMDSNGDADGSKLTADDWMKLAEASGELRRAALSLASIDKPVAVAAGGKIDDEGETGASTGAQVQGFIDANREQFRTHAAALGRISGDFLAASKKRDAKRLMDDAGRLDEVCEACHVKFWYPQDAVQN